MVKLINILSEIKNLSSTQLLQIRERPDRFGFLPSFKIVDPRFKSIPNKIFLADLGGDEYIIDGPQEYYDLVEKLLKDNNILYQKDHALNILISKKFTRVI